MLFIQYPKCSTCQKAKRFLDTHNVKYEDRNIVENNPTKEELREYLKQGIEIKKLFNIVANITWDTYIYKGNYGCSSCI